MNKKKIIILVFVAVIAVLIGMLMFTRLGREIRGYLYYRITTPKEKVELGEVNQVTVTYTYSSYDEVSFDIEVKDEELNNLITDSIKNKKLENYSSQIGLLIIGDYAVNLGDNVRFEFDSYDDDGYVMMYKNDKRFLTKINPNILSKVMEIVDKKLNENIEMYRTNEITIAENSEKCKLLMEMKEKTAIEYVLNKCKNVYIKEIAYEPMISNPEHEINFNNGIKLLVYKDNDKGWLLKDGILSEAYGLSTFDTILENAFTDITQKKKIFTTDKITITDPNKSIEITDKDVIDKITAPLIYSSMTTPEWLDFEYITEEYNNGIKIKINDYEFLIPGKKGTVTIGNRYVISPDKKVKLCFPLQDLEQYANELLGNKVEKPTGIVSIIV